MDTRIEKLDDQTIKITVPQLPIETTYTKDYLVAQKQAVQEKKDAENAVYDASLKQLDEYISKCDQMAVGDTLDISTL